MTKTNVLRSWCVLGVVLLAPACEEVGPTAAIETTRVATRPSGNVRPGATARERFGDSAQPPPSTSDDLLAYDLPAGWEALPPTGDRMIHVRPAGAPDAVCYLSFLGGDGGGLAANVNRWRTQLGLEPLAGDAIAALPTHPLLTKEATLVEGVGTFTGMGEAPRADFGLLGLIVSEEGGSLFLKFTGPAPLVAAERARFLAFADSLRLADGHGQLTEDPHAGHGHDGMPHPEEPAQASAGPLAWSVPPGWSVQPPRSMREVSFGVGAGAECYIARLGGGAGGLRANLDRWRDQFGLEPMSDAEFAALERIRMLGAEAPLLELEGAYSGMGSSATPGQALLGTAVFRAQDALFVKFTGPAEVVRAERANFIAFVASLEERR